MSVARTGPDSEQVVLAHRIADRIVLNGSNLAYREKSCLMGAMAGIQLGFISYAYREIELADARVDEISETTMINHEVERATPEKMLDWLADFFADSEGKAKA